jgi:hypothetical protein
MGFKVFLDDVRPVPQPDWILIKTVPELIALIQLIGEQIDVISLDHDLGENTPSGYDFVAWMEKKVFDKEYTGIPELRIHSANPVGRKRMESGIRAIWKRLDENS